MSNTCNFYRAFEDRYRGSRELILGRLKVYLDFLVPLKELIENASAVDLGCGRGEFLEVLLSAGFEAKGVDLDAGMLQACTELNLPAEKGDALAFLAKLPEESLAVVSAFHVVEHMPFEQLQSLVAEAYRVLKPGGILILETPNPENITVATVNFYLDPTHQRPIPPPLLTFVVEYAGFERVKILRLQESATLKEKPNVDLADVLSGASSDYSTVAQKAGSKRVSEALDNAFSKDYGLTASSLATRYEESRQRAFAQLSQANAVAKNEIGVVHEMIKSELSETRVRLERASGELGAALAEKEALAMERDKVAFELMQTRARLEQLVDQHDELQKEHEVGALSLAAAQKTLAETQRKLDEVRQANHRHWQLAEDRQRHINELLGSTCWRVTAPLRWLRLSLTPRFRTEKKQKFSDLLIGRIAVFARRHPMIKQKMLRMLFQYPRLHARVAHALANLPRAATGHPVASPSCPAAHEDSLSTLTAQARRIHAQILAVSTISY